MFYNCETLFYLINFYDYEKSKAYIKNIFFNCKSLILNSELIKFENENKILFEFILIGDHVGKTSLLYKLTQGDFKGYFLHSGIDFKNILIKVDIEKNNEIKKKIFANWLFGMLHRSNLIKFIINLFIKI